MKQLQPGDPRAAIRGRTVPAVAWIIAGLATAPLVALLVLASGNTGDVWGNLLANVLPVSIRVTVLLMAGVAISTALLGIGSAWLVSRHAFPGRNIVHWLLVLPLAIPTYISAYCFVEFLGFTGPVQTLLRDLFSFTSPADYWFPEIRSLPGAIFVMSVVLYPYVYLTCRMLFEFQGGSVIEAGRMLGAGSRRLFFSVALPLARPAVAAGIALALMETLNDIGAVELLGVRTLTFSIFDTWLNRSSLAGAAQIACLLLILAGLLLYLERRSRGARGYAVKHGGTVPMSRIQLTGSRGWLATVLCLIPPAAGFGVPMVVMLRYALLHPEQITHPQLQQAAANSVFVAVVAAFATTLAALILVAALHRVQSRLGKFIKVAATLGYAVPGSVLAVGILYALTQSDNAVDAMARQYLGITTGLLLSGSAFIVIYACCVRFFAVAHGALDAGHQRLSGRETMAARTLGSNARQAFVGIELPLLRRPLLTAMLLVFVEAMKELSATILLRPFNFPTLATHVYEFASRARFEDAAMASLAIVAIGAVPVILLSRLTSSGAARPW